MTAASLDAVDGWLLGQVVFAAAPGTIGWVLARRSWTGGVWVWRGLLALQAWLIVAGLGNIGDGSGRGLTQLFLPILIVVFMTRRESQEWFRLPDPERADRRPFSLARMIRWRRDEGQTAVEYAGLVAVVATVIGALLVSGLGTQISTGIQSAVCKVTGTACPADTGNGGEEVQARDGQNGTGDDGGANAGADGGSQGGSGNDAGGAGDADAGTGNGDQDSGDQGSGGSGSASGGADGGNGSSDQGGAGDDGSDSASQGTDGASGDDSGENSGQKNIQAADDNGDGEKKEDEGCFLGFGAFFGCAGDQIKQVGEGLFVDGIWGDVTGIWDAVTNPGETWDGLKDYGSSLGDQWSEDSKDAGEKWENGEYLDALTDWGDASVNTGVTALDDMFVGDQVRDQWNSGNETRAATNVLWNVGSLFIPGYGEGKVVQKLGKLGKLSKLTKFADDAAEAAEKVRKAAKAGDVEGAQKAAKEADEAADEAEKKARESGCTIASAPRRTVPYGVAPGLTGSSGTGTTAIAAGGSRSPYVILAEGDCDEEAKKQAEEARKQADDAEKAADGIDLQQAADEAKKTIADAKDKQKSPKSDRFQLDEKKIDNLVAKAKDNPDRGKGEFGKDELAKSLKDLSDMLKTKNIDNQSRGALGGSVLKANNRHQLAEAMAEVKAAKRAADNEAAEGTKVYAGIGKNKGREKVDLGDGTIADGSAIDDADVVYKGKDGNIHVAEVKNTGQATTQASMRAQAKRLADWQKANPGRKARYEIETQKDWDKVFDGFQKDKKTGEFPSGSPAETLAENGLDLRVAGQDISPQQLKAMSDAWKKKTDAEKKAARDSGKMKDPKTAMEYLGVS